MAAIVTTTLIVSGGWGWAYYRMVEMKDERIALLEDSGPREALQDLDGSIKSLEERIAPLALALQVDPLDGRLMVGSGMSTPTALTGLMMEAEAAIKEQQFDVAEDLADRLEDLYPRFPGALRIRWSASEARDYADEAIRHGQELIEQLPTEPRLLPVYAAVANRLLAKGDRSAAEQVALGAVRLDPDNEELRRTFEGIFGYAPRIQRR